MIRLLGILGVGALAMYYFDPVSGRRRREQLRVQLAHAKHQVRDYAEDKISDQKGMPKSARSVR